MAEENSLNIVQLSDENQSHQIIELNRRLNFAESKNIQLLNEIQIRDEKINELNQISNIYIEQINNNSLELTSIYQRISVLQGKATAHQSRINEQIGEKVNEMQKIIIELNQKNILQSQNLNRISYTMKIPISTIFNSLQFIENKLEKEEIKSNISQIRMAANKLNQTIDNLTILSEIETKKISNNPQIIFVNQISNFISEELFELAKIKKLDFDVHFMDPNSKFYADPALFQVVIQIILENAINFTKKGFVRIETEKYYAGGIESILIKFKDSGIGISKENLEWIFKPNKLVNDDKFSENQNIGISMAIAKKVVEIMKGDIGISSTLGKGTTIILQLPTTY
jgi:signal transduction histidine kinase